MTPDSEYRERWLGWRDAVEACSTENNGRRTIDLDDLARNHADGGWLLMFEPLGLDERLAHALTAAKAVIDLDVPWDDEPWDPGDLPDPEPPAEVVGVVATVTVAGEEVGFNALWGIGSDYARDDPYVWHCLADVLADAISEAQVGATGRLLDLCKKASTLAAFVEEAT